MGRFSPDPGPTPDAVLLDAMGRGDYSAFVELYARHRDRAQALADRLLADAREPTSAASTASLLVAMFTRLIEQRPRAELHEDLWERLSSLGKQLTVEDRFPPLPLALTAPTRTRPGVSPWAAPRTPASSASSAASRNCEADSPRSATASLSRSPVDALVAEQLWRHLESLRTARKVRRWGLIALLAGAAALVVWLLRLAGYSPLF